MREYVLALDLGGTNSRFGAVTSNGEIIARLREKTPDATGELLARFFVEQFRFVERQVSGDSNLLAIAAAVPAVFDAETGIPVRLPNIPQLEGIDLAKIFKDELGVHAFLENDATAATIGEHWLGASKGYANVIGITLGTGIGGGLIIEGKPFRGKDGSAGEIGHICVEPNGVTCGCGSRGCVEQYASGTAIVRQAKDAGLSVETAKDVYELFESGDAIAASIFESIGRYLGIALGCLVNVLNPDAIVLGGGVAAAWDAFIDSLEKEIDARSFDAPGKRVKILLARLGDDAGLLGAARVAFRTLGL